MQQIALFRPATPVDAEAISFLVNAGYRGESSQKGWTTEAHLLGGQRIDPEKVCELIATPNQIILIWPHANEKDVTACVLLERKAQTAYLGMLTVNPLLQNTGMGRQILKVAEAWVQREWGSKQIEMTVVSVRHELISWYQRRGYSLTEETRPFPMEDQRFGLPKVDHLEFVVLVKTL